jgi:hypothetical protein
MPLSMVNHDEADWRLRGQEKYLAGVALYRKRWTQTRDNWDHDHCQFCWANFAADENPETLHEGYTDGNEYWWICEPCFEDFRERFAWKLPDSN